MPTAPSPTTTHLLRRLLACCCVRGQSFEINRNDTMRTLSLRQPYCLCAGATSAVGIGRVAGLLGSQVLSADRKSILLFLCRDTWAVVPAAVHLKGSDRLSTHSCLLGTPIVGICLNLGDVCEEDRRYVPGRRPPLARVDQVDLRVSGLLM